MSNLGDGSLPRKETGTIPKHSVGRGRGHGRNSSRTRKRGPTTREDLEREHLIPCKMYEASHICAKGVRCQRLHRFHLFDVHRDMAVALDGMAGLIYNLTFQVHVMQALLESHINPDEQTKVRAAAVAKANTAIASNRMFRQVSGRSTYEGSSGRSFNPVNPQVWAQNQNFAQYPVDHREYSFSPNQYGAPIVPPTLSQYSSDGAQQYYNAAQMSTYSSSIQPRPSLVTHNTPGLTAPVMSQIPQTTLFYNTNNPGMQQ